MLLSGLSELLYLDVYTLHTVRVACFALSDPQGRERPAFGNVAFLLSIQATTLLSFSAIRRLHYTKITVFATNGIDLGLI